MPDLVAIVVVCLALLGVYAWHLQGEFLAWDDDQFIVNNPHVAQLSAENVIWAFSGIRFDTYQPLQFISYMVDGSLWCHQVFACRLHSLVVFVVAACLLFFLLRRHGFSSLASLLGTLVFALAPGRVESVIWVSARKDVLLLLLVIAVWHVHLLNPQSRKRKIAVWGVEYVLFVLALLSKASAFVLPVIFIVMDMSWYGVRLKQTLFRNAFPLLLCLFYAVFLPLLWQQANLINIQISDGIPERIGLVYWSLERYIISTVFPFWLSPLYAAPDDSLLRIAFISGGVASVAIAIILFFLLKRHLMDLKWPGLLLLFLVAIAPYLNIVPMYYLVADRYLLIPSLALALGTALLIHQAEERIPGKWLVLLTAIALTWIAANGISASLYAGKWRDSLTFFGTAAARQPHSFWSQMKYGEVLRLNGQYQRAEVAYRNARKIRPLSSSAMGGVFWCTFEQDCMAQHRRCRDAQDVTAFLIVHGSDVKTLQGLYQRLANAGFTNSAAVVEQRLAEMGH